MSNDHQDIIPAENEQSTSQSEGLSPNLAALLAYLVGFVTGIIFLFVKPDDKFVRFHLWQSIIVFGSLFVLNILFFILDVVLVMIPVIGWLIGIFTIIISILLTLLQIALWIYLMVQAYNGKEPSIPIAGGIARNLANK